MDKVIKIIKKYEDKVKRFPDLQKAVQRLIIDHKRIKEKEKRDKENKNILLHELKGPLTVLGGNLQMLMMKKDLLPAEVNDLIKNSLLGVEYLTYSTELLYLEGATREELQKNSERLNLEKLVRNHALINNRKMKEGKIGLELNYDMINGSSREIYANRAVFDVMIGNLFGNSLNWTTENSNIIQGIKIKESGESEELEILIENKYIPNKKQRETTGMGKKYGHSYIKERIKALGGEFSIYQTPEVINNVYSITERIGYEGGKNPTKTSKIFGVKVTVPMQELTRQSQKQDENK